MGITAAAAAASAGPGWTDILTAIGTVGAVIVAVGIALWTEYRSDKRIKEERARSDRMLAEQREQEKAAVEDERAHGRAQLEEERRIARERLQLDDAYRVQVVLAQRSGDSSGETMRLAAMVVNRGSYTITRIEAQFASGTSPGNSITPHHSYERLSSVVTLPTELRGGWAAAAERPLSGVLTPLDLGILFMTDQIHRNHLGSPYPIVRWTDHWGTRWEHKRGTVRRVGETDPWEL